MSTVKLGIPPDHITYRDLYDGADFPIGRPFVAIRDWDPDNDAHWDGITHNHMAHRDDFIPIQKGDEGYIDSLMGIGVILVVLTRKEETGCIPWQGVVNIGNVMYGDITWNIALPQFQFNTSADDLPGSTVLEKTIHGLLQGFCTSTEARQHVSSWSLEMLGSTAKCRQIGDLLIQGIKDANMFDVLRDGKANMQTIRDSGNDQPGDVSCVYLIVYECEDDDGVLEAWFEVYGGMTQSFRNRNQGHILSSRTVETAHYRTARRALTRKMFPICRLDGAGDEIKNLRLLMEQCVLCMFQLYHPYITAPIKPVPLPLLAGDLGKHVHAQKAACVLMGIALPVFQKMGWVTGAWELDPNHPSNLKRGLNWDSPITDENKTREKQIISKSVAPGQMEVYRSRERRVYNQSTGSGENRRFFPVYFALRLKGSSGTHFEITGAVGDPAPIKDEKIYVIFEIVPDNVDRAHPLHWATLPTVGAPHSWQLARKLGIRIEWREKGTGDWKRRYLICDPKRCGPKASYPSFEQALAMIRWLRREEITNHRPNTQDYGVANIWNFTFHHLTQTFNFKRDATLVNQVSAMARDMPRTLNAIKSNLSQEGFQEFDRDNRHQIFEHLGTRRRESCDRCFLVKPGQKEHIPNLCPTLACEFAPGESVCKPCKFNNLLCTWSSRAALMAQTPAGARLRNALLSPKVPDRRLKAEDIPNSTAIDFTGGVN